MMEVRGAKSLCIFRYHQLSLKGAAGPTAGHFKSAAPLELIKNRIVSFALPLQNSTKHMIFGVHTERGRFLINDFFKIPKLK